MTTVHRLLDDAFSGVVLTPELQDLKEEMRTNLLARVAELEASGVLPPEAARRAFDELGDVQALIEAESAGPVTSSSGSPAPRAAASVAAAVQRNKVRPRPGFVVGVVLAGLLALAAVAGLALTVTDVVTGTALPLLAAVVAALATGWIVTTSLLQETTTNHPLPFGRALGYGIGSAAAVLGLGLVASGIGLGDALVAWFVPAGIALVIGAVVLSWLGATQTNRKKAWVREVMVDQMAGNRFEEDPDAAARFGMYTGVIWIVAFAAFVVVGLTAGWAWSWLAFVGALVLTMLVLARTLFGERKDQDRGSPRA
jgi:hypothetical protein